ncbi:jmjC domain-containing protein 8 isoform 1-T1 [Alca torda]
MAAARRLLSLLLPLAWARPAASADPPGGGWLAGSVPEEERCTVERADASLTYSLFLQRFAFSRPVILRGFTDNSAFRALCTREKLLAAFGALPVRLSTANTYSYRKGKAAGRAGLSTTPPGVPGGPAPGYQHGPPSSPLPAVDVPFQEYVEHLLKPQDPARLGSDTLYFFGDNNFTEWGSLFQEYMPPPFRIPGTSAAYSFGIAGSGSGVPFHWHGPGYSEVIFGRKRWFLYPPDKTPHFHPNETTLAWLHRTYPMLPPAQRPLECTLRPGEVRLARPASSQLSTPLGRAQGTPQGWTQETPSPWSPQATPLRSPGRSCTSPTTGGTPRSTWTPASSSPPSWDRARKDEDTSPSSWPRWQLLPLPGKGSARFAPSA